MVLIKASMFFVINLQTVFPSIISPQRFDFLSEFLFKKISPNVNNNFEYSFGYFLPWIILLQNSTLNSCCCCFGKPLFLSWWKNQLVIKNRHRPMIFLYNLLKYFSLHFQMIFFLMLLHVIIQCFTLL